MFKHYRLIFILIGLNGPISLFAQELKGVVIDIESRKPIANAQIITNKATVLTNTAGVFILKDIKLGTSAAVRIMGYETIELTIHKLTDTLKIYLRQNAVTLNEVQIKSKRNYKLDSLKMRNEYASAFTNKGPSFSAMFIGRDPDYDSPFSFTNPKSTASLVSLNLLQIFSLFGKKQVQATKFQQTLIRDEELNYVDQFYSKDKVKSITGLEGEPLLNFMSAYRPSTLSLKKMTGYELTLYIKRSYQEYLKLKQ